jgi:hypothetical protein
MQLRRRGEPLREWFEEYLGDLGRLQADARAAGSPTFVPPRRRASHELALVGTAFDYLLRAELMPAFDADATVAALGALRLGAVRPLWEGLSAEVHTLRALGSPGCSWALERWVRVCFGLALFEQGFRAGRSVPLSGLPGSAGLDDILALCPDDAVRDLHELLAASLPLLPEGGRWRANPTFAERLEAPTQTSSSMTCCLRSR